MCVDKNRRTNFFWLFRTLTLAEIISWNAFWQTKKFCVAPKKKYYAFYSHMCVGGLNKKTFHPFLLKNKNLTFLLAIRIEHGEKKIIQAPTQAGTLSEMHQMQPTVTAWLQLFMSVVDLRF